MVCELKSNLLAGRYSWWHVLSKTRDYRGGFSDNDQIFRSGTFGFELTEANRYKPEVPAPARRAAPAFQDRYPVLPALVADFDAVYVLEPGKVPAAGLKRVAVGVCGRKPQAVVYGNWGAEYERLTDANGAGTPRDDVLKSAVAYELRGAELKGKIIVERRVPGFQPKKTEESFEIQLNDRSRHKRK